MSKLKIHTRYNPPPTAGIVFTEPTRTQQHFKNETDINQIVARAIATKNTAIFTPTQRATYYDCTVYADYQQALDRIADVEDDFLSLPSSIRKEFGNNVDQYVAFMTNPDNIGKAVELGLLEGGEKTTATPPASGPSNPSGDPKPPVSEPSAAAPTPAGHSST